MAPEQDARQKINKYDFLKLKIEFNKKKYM
jgi:hypothetical protein